MAQQGADHFLNRNPAMREALLKSHFAEWVSLAGTYNPSPLLQVRQLFGDKTGQIIAAARLCSLYIAERLHPEKIDFSDPEMIKDLKGRLADLPTEPRLNFALAQLDTRFDFQYQKTFEFIGFLRPDAIKAAQEADAAAAAAAKKIDSPWRPGSTGVNSPPAEKPVSSEFVP